MTFNLIKCRPVPYQSGSISMMCNITLIMVCPDTKLLAYFLRGQGAPPSSSSPLKFGPETIEKLA